MTLQKDAQKFRELFAKAKKEIGAVVVGNDKLVDDLLICLFAGGHALLEGVPGLGKTLLVKTVGECFGLKFSRIQFTPDLMPADIIGTNFVVETPEGKAFRFEKGPIFAQVILADEINRAAPRTQSALLEAMQESSVTVGGTHYPLKQPFLVLATQNPIEMEGTYPLPEAQLDRFLFKLTVPFPDQAQIKKILEREPSATAKARDIVCGADEIEKFKQLILSVPVPSSVVDYAARLVLATHPGQFPPASRVSHCVRYGASPRGAIALILGAKVRALLDGRLNVSFDDVRAVAKPALRHRVILNFEGESEGLTAEDILDEILSRLPLDDTLSSGTFSQLLHSK